jgi:hypothetical protein
MLLLIMIFESAAKQIGASHAFQLAGGGCGVFSQGDVLFPGDVLFVQDEN